MQRPQEMMTAREATHAFRNAGLSETTFRKRVKDGKIEKHLPPERKRGALYPKDQVLTAINETAKEHKKTKGGSILPPTTFVRATPADMPEIAELLERLFNAKINIEKRAAWIERNPEICYILRCEGKVVGCGFLMPLTEEKILTILSKEVQPPTKPDEILLYELGTHIYLYVRSVGVLQQGVSGKQKKYWAKRLLLGLSKAVIELGARGIIIEKIYGYSDTKAGERVMRMMGFTQITTITSHKNFVIDIDKSGLELVMRYKKNLNYWRMKNEEE